MALTGNHHSNPGYLHGLICFFNKQKWYTLWMTLYSEKNKKCRGETISFHYNTSAYNYFFDTKIYFFKINAMHPPL